MLVQTVIINDIILNVDAIELTISSVKKIKTLLLRTNKEIAELETLKNNEITVFTDDYTFNMYVNNVFFNNVDSYYIV